MVTIKNYYQFNSRYHSIYLTKNNLFVMSIPNITDFILNKAY